MLIRSMRFQLTLLFVALFGGAQLLLWLVVDRVRTNYLQSELDRQLTDHALSMLRAIEDVGAGQEGKDPGAAIAERLRPFELEGLVFEVRDGDGVPLVRSDNLHGVDLPFAANSVRSFDNADHGLIQLDTISVGGAVDDSGGPLRLVTIRGPPHRGHQYTLQAAVGLRPMHVVVTTSRRLIIVFGIVGLVLAALTAWYVTGRSLAPLRDLTRTAQRVSAAKLAERSDVEAAPDEVGTAIAAVNDMLDRLEREFRQLDRFVANISHELKTPLAVLLGEAQSRRGQPTDCDGDGEFTATVEQETRRMLRTIDAFLILAKARAQARLTVTRAFALEDAVLAAIQACRAQAAEKGIRILEHFDADDDADEPKVAGDPDLVRSMIENILHNAIRHSVPDTCINLTIKCAAREVTIFVRDRGPGIPEDQLDTIFDRFYQGESGQMRAGVAGLGLAIVKAVAELHGGRVAVGNLADGGCEFSVTLPLLMHDLSRITNR